MRKIDEIKDDVRNIGNDDGVTKPQIVTAAKRNKIWIGIAVVIVAAIVFVVTR